MRRRHDRIAVRSFMRDERRDLRDLLEVLSPEQWRSESLCTGWTVRDLAAHLVAWDDVLLYRCRREHVRGLLWFTALYLRSLGSTTRVNRRLAAETSSIRIDELGRRFGSDDNPDLKWLFDGTNPGAHLAEYVIHHQDIRRPLGLPRRVPPDRLVAALNGLPKLPGLRIPARRRTWHRRWQATDVDWSRGRGPPIRGPGEAILMALAGRSTAHNDLDDPV